MALIPIVGSVLQNQFLLQQQQQKQQQQQEEEEEEEEVEEPEQDAPESPENNSDRDSDQNSCDEETKKDEGIQNDEAHSSREELSADSGCGIYQSVTDFVS